MFVNYPLPRLLICKKDIPVVVVPPFRSLRTPPDLDADASPELPALRENIRQLQQRLTTAESCLTGLIGIFQGQLIDQRTGLLPEWLHPYVKEVSKDQDHLPSTSGRAATPVERQGPSPGQTIYSPRTQRPLNPPTLPIPNDSPTPTASAIEPPAVKSIEELADLPVPTQRQPTEESSVQQPDTLKNGAYFLYFVTRVPNFASLDQSRSTWFKQSSKICLTPLACKPNRRRYGPLTCAILHLVNCCKDRKVPPGIQCRRRGNMPLLDRREAGWLLSIHPFRVTRMHFRQKLMDRHLTRWRPPALTTPRSKIVS